MEDFGSSASEDLGGSGVVGLRGAAPKFVSLLGASLGPGTTRSQGWSRSDLDLLGIPCEIIWAVLQARDRFFLAGAPQQP